MSSLGSRSRSSVGARLTLLATLIFSSACVSSRAFMPTEHVTAFSPSGEHYAAEYSLEEGGTALADVKVWSAGAERDGSDAQPHTEVRVGFEVSNHAPTPVRLDTERLFLEETPRDGAPRGHLAAANVSGDPLVPPGESRQLDVRFTLPSSVWPSDVPGYRVAWSLSGRQSHARKTPFLREVDTRPADVGYPYYGYYYPGFYGSWSFGARGWPPPWRTRRFYYER